MSTAFPVCDSTFRSAAVLPLQKSLFVLFLSLQNAGQADDDDEVSYVSTA